MRLENYIRKITQIYTKFNKNRARTFARPLTTSEKLNKISEDLKKKKKILRKLKTQKFFQSKAALAELLVNYNQNIFII